VAEEIFNTSADRVAAFKETNWYNTSEKSYKEGLAERDPRLLGVKVDTLQPEGTIKVKVPRHRENTERCLLPWGQA
jgi:hypothetical protein